jgi:L-lactate dehydrogenase complex protein LldG
MNSRDAILQRIRAELAKPGATGGSPAGADPPPLPEVWPSTNPTREELIERFTEELTAVDGEIVRCGSMDEARRELARLVEQSEWKTLGSVQRPICRELLSDLTPQQVAWVKDGSQPQEMARLSAGLVAAQRLLADTGTCVIECNTAEERLMCYLPPACVVIARVDQLAEHMPAAWEEIARRTADPQRRGEFVLVTGPSRTADIEKILVLGVHGPKRLVVILVG